MNDAVQSYRLAVINGSVLAVSSLNLETMLKLVQLALLVATLVYTYRQIQRDRRKTASEETMDQTIRKAQADCEKAKAGLCPLAQRLAESRKE